MAEAVNKVQWYYYCIDQTNEIFNGHDWQSVAQWTYIKIQYVMLFEFKLIFLIVISIHYSD